MSHELSHLLGLFLHTIENTLVSFYSPLTEMTTKSIHGKEESLADWLNNHSEQFMSPTISLQWVMPLLFQGRTSRVRLIIQARTPLQLPVIQRLIVRRLWEYWLHHCTYRKERQVLTHPEFLSPIEKVGGELIILPIKRGENCSGVHTKKKSKAQSVIPTRKESYFFLAHLQTPR